MEFQGPRWPIRAGTPLLGMAAATCAQPCWLCARGCRPISCTQPMHAGEGTHWQAGALHASCAVQTCIPVAQPTCNARASCASDQLHAPPPLLRSVHVGAPLQADRGQPRSMRHAPRSPSCFRCRPPALHMPLARTLACTPDRPCCALCAQVHQARVDVAGSAACAKLATMWAGWLLNAQGKHGTACCWCTWQLHEQPWLLTTCWCMHRHAAA